MSLLLRLGIVGKMWYFEKVLNSPDAFFCWILCDVDLGMNILGSLVLVIASILLLLLTPVWKK